MNKISSNNQVNRIVTLSQAQEDMSTGYANDSIGILISGLIWFISAIVSSQFSAKEAI